MAGSTEFSFDEVLDARCTWQYGDRAQQLVGNGKGRTRVGHVEREVHGAIAVGIVARRVRTRGEQLLDLRDERVRVARLDALLGRKLDAVLVAIKRDVVSAPSLYTDMAGLL